MRVASIVTLSAAAAFAMTLVSSGAEAQYRRGYRDNTERITIVDENGRARTKITVRPRSYLDGGTQVFPGERKFTDYAFPPTYMNGSAYAAWDPTGSKRTSLPLPFELPGYNPYTPY